VVKRIYIQDCNTTSYKNFDIRNLHPGLYFTLLEPYDLSAFDAINLKHLVQQRKDDRHFALRDISVVPQKGGRHPVVVLQHLQGSANVEQARGGSLWLFLDAFQPAPDRM